MTVVDDDTTAPEINIYDPLNDTICIRDDRPFIFDVRDPDVSQPGVIHLLLTRDAGAGPVAVFEQTVDPGHAFYRRELYFSEYGTGLFELTITATNDDDDRHGDAETSTKSQGVTVVDCGVAQKASLGDLVWHETPEQARRQEVQVGAVVDDQDVGDIGFSFRAVATR